MSRERMQPLILSEILSELFRRTRTFASRAALTGFILILVATKKYRQQLCNFTARSIVNLFSFLGGRAKLTDITWHALYSILAF